MEKLASESFETRSYQLKGRQKMMQFFAKWIKLELEARPDKELTTAMLINMATGSGKTKTVGDFLNDLYELRERFYKLYPSKDKLPIHALVLNDRINLVDQLRQDFFEGRKANKKPPIFSPAFREQTEVKTYHSKADDIFETLDLDEDQIEAYMEQENDIGKVRVQTLNKRAKKKHNDTFSFSTFQTALEGLSDENPYNVIVIDEGHVLTGPKYLEAFRKYYKPLPSGHYPLVVVMTATPTNKLRVLTGKEIFKYGLAEYIMSPDCPKVNYNVVGLSKLTLQEKVEIYKTLDRIKNIQDAREKKRQLNEFEKYLQQALSKNISVKQLCSDFMNRVKNKDHTIVFTSSIDEANQVVKELNKQTGDENFAVALHSKVKGKAQDIIDDYNDGKHKIIVAVDMLNQGIDMPKTNNIVFWRHTDSALIFFQQLGRGLRGDEVNIYDYIGGIKNLVWINQVNDEIDEFVEMRRQEGENVEKKKMDISVSHLTTKPEDELEDDFDAIKIEYVDDTAKDPEEPYEINPANNLPYISDEEVEAEGEGNEYSLPNLTGISAEQMPQLIENWFSLQAIVGNMKEMRENATITFEEVKKEFDNLGGYETLIGYSNKEIENVSIKSYKITAIETACGFRSQHGFATITVSRFKELVSYIYGKEFNNGVTDQEIVSYFKDEGDINYWKGISRVERAEIRFGDKGLMALAGQLGLTVNPVNSQREWFELLEFIYKEKIKRLNLEDVRAAFKNKGDIEYWAGLSVEERKMQQIDGRSLRNIAAELELKLNLIGVTSDWHYFLEKIYGEKSKNHKIKIIKVSKDKISMSYVKEELDKLGGYDTLINYDSDMIVGRQDKGIVGIKIGGYGIMQIGTSLGFKSKHGLFIANLYGFQEFISLLYNKPFEVPYKELNDADIREGLDKLGGYDTLMKYSNAQIGGSEKNNVEPLRINGNGIVRIASFYNFKPKSGLKVTSPNGFYEFIAFIYGKEFVRKEITLDEAKQQIKSIFNNNNIKDITALLRFGSTKFIEKIGYSLTNKVLGRNMSMGTITLETLKELGTALDLPLGDPKEEMRIALMGVGVTNINELIEFGPRRFQEKFGSLKLREILGKGSDRGVSLKSLKKMGIAIGFIEIKPEEKLKSQLLQLGITDMISLKKYGVVDFSKNIGRTLPGQILKRQIDKINVELLEEIGKALGFEDLTYKDQLKAKLNQLNIRDIPTLKDYGAGNFSRQFGRTLIGKVLSRRMKSITQEDLTELGEKLGLESATSILKRKLLEINISNTYQLLEYGVVRFEKIIGASLALQVLKKTQSGLKNSDLEVIGSIIGFEKPKIEDVIKSKLKTLGITTMSQLKEMGVPEYVQYIGKALTKKILGDSAIQYITASIIEDVGRKLGW